MNNSLKNIIQQLSEVLQSIPDELQELHEFSLSRKKVKDKIEEYADDIMDHICKILYLRDYMPNTVRHWCSEILAKVNLIIRRGIKGGSLNHFTLVSWLRNGLDRPSEMVGRRNLVAIQENLTLDKLKTLESEKDYKYVMTVISRISNLVLDCKNTVRQATLNDIEEITKE